MPLPRYMCRHYGSRRCPMYRPFSGVYDICLICEERRYMQPKTRKTA